MGKRKLLKLYKGYDPRSKKRIRTGHAVWDSYFFAADTPKAASNYGHRIDEIDVSPNAKILWEGSRSFPRGRGWRRGQSMLDWAAEVVRKSIDDGYDAVHFERQGDIGTVVTNTKILSNRRVWGQLF